MSIVKQGFAIVVMGFLWAGPAVGQGGEELPFHLPVPEGWRTETLPFPLDFASELTYEGLEELRLSPGMFQEVKVDYWSYAFVWWVPEETEFDTDRLNTDLRVYYEGLNKAVAEAREFELPEFEVEVQLEPDGEAGDLLRWRGTARTLDVFTTRRPVRLNVQVDLLECPEHGRLAAIFLLTPQPRRNSIWTVLHGMREEFRCSG